MAGQLIFDYTHEPENPFQSLVVDIQVLAGAAPYATAEELLDLFTSLADRVPRFTRSVDVMVLRRILAHATGCIHRHLGAPLPMHRVVNLVADADDPTAEFKAVLSQLRAQCVGCAQETHSAHR